MLFGLTQNPLYGRFGATATCGYASLTQSLALKPKDFSIVGHTFDLLKNIYTAFAMHFFSLSFEPMKMVFFTWNAGLFHVEQWAFLRGRAVLFTCSIQNRRYAFSVAKSQLPLLRFFLFAAGQVDYVVQYAYSVCSTPNYYLPVFFLAEI
jgi:hypothetical protein